MRKRLSVYCFLLFSANVFIKFPTISSPLSCIQASIYILLFSISCSFKKISSLINLKISYTIDENRAFRIQDDLSISTFKLNPQTANQYKEEQKLIFYQYQIQSFSSNNKKCLVCVYSISVSLLQKLSIHSIFGLNKFSVYLTIS